MDFFTHSVFGALLYILFLKGVTLEYLFLATFFSILPDLDVFITPLKRIFKSNYLEHRGGSHSYIIGIIMSALLGVINSIFMHRPFFIVWGIGILFYGLHISMDLLTTTKIPYLFPISKKEHSFYIEKAGSFFTMINSLIFIVLIISFQSFGADITSIRLLINLYTTFFIIYYLYRIISKLWLSSRLEKHQKYLPGVFPFFYIIYNQLVSESEVSLSLERGSHFSRKKEIKNSSAILSTEEKALFEKGLEMCKASYYYAKWTLFPTFIRSDGIFSVKFFFLETMMRNRTMYNQYDFGKLAQQVISINQGSGRFLNLSS
ncbi:MAG: metal-dependent hydrolase [Promethearchaeota archaeon]|jgi:membrane-bound metal-dependent hydrolase YbcI (DUF457 family)